MSCVIGLDIGTTSTIGILIRMPGERLALASRPVTLSHRHAGWAEEDPQQWWDNVCAIIPQLLAQAGVAALCRQQTTVEPIYSILAQFVVNITTRGRYRPCAARP